LRHFRPAAANETFNMTRGEGRTLNELVGILKGWFPNLRVEKKAANRTRPRRGALDISKARRLLGYSPRYSLEAGLAETVTWYKGENA
jgi:UDP-glucose 4-epimerase